MQPGSPTVFLNLRDPENEDTPAHRLEAMGYDAVPQLIEALTDELEAKATELFDRVENGCPVFISNRDCD